MPWVIWCTWWQVARMECIRVLGLQSGSPASCCHAGCPSQHASRQVLGVQQARDSATDNLSVCLGYQAVTAMVRGQSTVSPACVARVQCTLCGAVVNTTFEECEGGMCLCTVRTQYAHHRRHHPALRQLSCLYSAPADVTARQWLYPCVACAGPRPLACSSHRHLLLYAQSTMPNCRVCAG